MVLQAEALRSENTFYQENTFYNTSRDERDGGCAVARLLLILSWCVCVCVCVCVCDWCAEQGQEEEEKGLGGIQSTGKEQGGPLIEDILYREQRKNSI